MHGSDAPYDEDRRHPGSTNGRRQDAQNCQLCGTAPLERFETTRGVVMWRCPQCGLYQNGMLCANEQYDGQYHDIYVHRLPHKVVTAAARLSRVAGLAKQSRPRMLEVGCSLGATLEAAAARGWDAVGVDVSRDAVEFCRGRGLNSVAVDGRTLPFDDGSFDVLASWHVIEHVPDVQEALAEWRRVLRPGGVMMLETPDASCLKVRRLGPRYTKFWKPEHIYTFTPATLRGFLERAGFELLRPPLFGRIQDLPLNQACYAVGHQLLDGLMYVTGLRKAFQVFARRIETVPAIVPFQGRGNAERSQVRRAA